MLEYSQLSKSIKGQIILDVLRILNISSFREYTKSQADVSRGLLDGPIDPVRPILEI